MYVLGLTTLGDAAATLICDGTVVAAAEEERFSRVKHHVGFPYEAVAYCLDEAGITLADVEHVALYWKPWILRRKAVQAVKSRGHLARPCSRRGPTGRGAGQRRATSGCSAYPRLLRKHVRPERLPRSTTSSTTRATPPAPSSSRRSSGAAILTMDGTGEDTTTMFAPGRGHRRSRR